MTDYTELIRSLRCENTGDDECGSSDCPYWSGLGCMDGQLMEDAADAIEALQAEVERLKDCNEELREKQTYIDHYGDKWMTSAKDVPTAAYKHGYADGRDEAEAQLPKHGEWIKQPEVKNIYGGEVIECPFCGEKYVVQNVSDEKFCRNCGADMRAKMEVQE